MLAAAAARVIAQAGLGGASLRDVAAEAGATTGTLTHYFADKRELLLFTLRASLEQVRRARPGGDGDGLRALLERALPLDEDRVLHWRVTLAFCAQAGDDEELASVQQRAYRSFHREVEACLAAGVAEGRLRADLEPAEEAANLIAVADGVAVQALFDPSAWPAERQRAALARHLDVLAAA